MFNNYTKFNFMILWDTLRSLFHAFGVYDLGIILLKGVNTLTKVINWTKSQNNDMI
jgi:hypothetical protein